MSMCAKMMSYWVRKVLSIAKAHMSVGTFLGAVASAALEAGIFMMSILQAGDWNRIATLADFIFNIYHHHRSVPRFSSACCLGPYE